MIPQHEKSLAADPYASTCPSGALLHLQRTWCSFFHAGYELHLVYCFWLTWQQCAAGVLAPSAAFGLVLHERLKNAGYELHVGDADKKSQ